MTIYPKASSTPAADTEQTGVPSSPRFPRLEENVLAYWKSDDTFNASVERNPAGSNGANEFVFYDGPPFANGLPHYGHLLTGYVKDIVPRYQTMRVAAWSVGSAGTATGCPPSWRRWHSWA